MPLDAVSIGKPRRQSWTTGRNSTASVVFVKRFPGSIEKVSHGEPTFVTPQQVFAMFANNHHGDGHVAVWLPAAAGVQAALIEEAPETYSGPHYVGAGFGRRLAYRHA